MWSLKKQAASPASKYIEETGNPDGGARTEAGYRPTSTCCRWSEMTLTAHLAVRCAIYARSATTDPGCEMQLRELRGYVERRHWVLVEEYIDTGCSGIGNRPQMTRLMADIRPREIGCVLVWSLNRWGRSLAGCLSAIDSLCSRGVGWIAVSEGINFCRDDPGSAARLGLLDSIRRFGSEMKRERVRASIRIAKRRGGAAGQRGSLIEARLPSCGKRENRSARSPLNSGSGGARLSGF